MELMIAYILAVYFGIGAVAMWLITRKKDALVARNGWIKYFVYLGVVLLTIFSIRYRTAGNILFAIILIIAAFEIVWIVVRSETQNYLEKIIGILAFAVIAFGFWQFGGWNGSMLVTMVYTVVFTFDGFSQISGQLFGKRKLITAISPEKTVAGLVGGSITGISTGVMLLWIADSSFHFITSLLQSGFVCLAAFLGDLGASYFKRICGVKDYSNVIPGHGGVLDRFDSFIAAGALVFYLLLIVSVL